MTVPNIVLVVSDDEPKGLIEAMPVVASQIRDQGLDFAHYICPTALCSPSRAALFTGKHSHNTGVWTNYPSKTGAWNAFKRSETDTIAVQLRSQGYYTALVGKYMNKFSNSPDLYVPPGWTQFVTMIAEGGEGAGSYYDYSLVGTIYPEAHGSAPSDYSTDVLRDHAVNIINNAPETQPLFLYFAPWGPHGNFQAAPRHVGTWPNEDPVPAFNEADLSDKPNWIQNLPPANESRETSSFRKMHDVVMSIDEAVDALLNALTTTGRLSNTLFIYLSDNGKMLGAHRLVKKDMPHRMAAEVPCYMRWDGHFTPGTEVTRLTGNVDIPATIADAAGVTGWQIDGIPYPSPRTGLPAEQMDNPEQQHPAYCGYRTERYLYIEYTRGVEKGKELYDYQTDPYELNNLAYDDAYTSLLNDMAAQARAVCDPTPPGFRWRVN